MIQPDFSGIQLKTRQEEGRTAVWDPVRKKWVALTPEEHVRQYVLLYMLQVLQYPQALIAVEKAIKVGAMNKRFDIVVYSRDHRPWMLVECKSPDVAVDERTLHQLLNYHSAVPCSYWALSNGGQNFCADARDTNAIKWLLSFPAYDM